MEEYGHDLVFTSAHFGARPEHEVWQGKAFSLSGRKLEGGVVYPDFYQATEYGQITGIYGVNCRHSHGPYYAGITELPTIEETRDGLTSDEYYKLTQKQRTMERRIRNTKSDIAQLERAGVSSAQKRLVLGQQQHRLYTFTKQNNLVRQAKREKAYGIGAQPRALRVDPRPNKAVAREAFVPNAKLHTGYEVDYDVVNSQAFHKKFEGLTEFSRPVREAAYKQSGRLLRETNGKPYERAIVINAKTGAFVLDTFEHETVKFSVGFTEKEFRKMAAEPNGVLVLHNHPNGSRPSPQDIITNAKNDFIKGGMTIGHDGYVYYFASDNLEVEKLYWETVDKLKPRYGDRAHIFARTEIEKSNSKNRLFKVRRL
ncbi:MAG: phage minor capsid protein [Coriobacteriales bacterium]|jgi:hypothetical protein|nr:phage minor capsid protein [Coriobacteriales bacterium]